MQVATIFSITPFLSVLKHKENMAYFHEHKCYKDFFGSWIGPIFTVIALDPDAARFVLKDPRFRKSSITISPNHTEYMRDNLVTIDGDDWRRVRSVVNFGFTKQALSSYFATFLELTEKSINKITLERDIDVTDFFSRYTLDVLGQTVFNRNFGRIDGENEKHYAAYKKFWEIFSSPWLGLMIISPSFSKLPVKLIQEWVNCVDELVDFFKQIMKENKGKIDNSILTHLIAAMENENGLLSEREIISNIWVLFVAGHETTSSALAWALNYLRLYPNIQQKIYEEIQRVVGDRTPKEEDLDKLVYLDNFINEVLRIRTPAPLVLSRTATEDIPYKDMIIPKGSLVGVHYQMIHCNPLYWAEPEKFNPDRFSPENRKGRNNFAYLPFSAGPRQCIGTNFSLIEQRLFITRVLQKYRVVDPVDTEPFPEDKYFIIAAPEKNVCPVRFEKRIDIQ
jgi:cytochrome P450